MALPHLKEDGTRNSNFKNSYEANFVSRSRMQQKSLDSRDLYVEKQKRYDNFNASYDHLISDDVYEKSLKSFIALKEKARKDNELIGRRERLSYLLRCEQRMFLDELKSMDKPECQLLYDDIRQKGFFEILYEKPNGGIQTVVPPHLVSEYEQQQEQGDECIRTHEAKRRQKEELRDFLLNQQREKLSRLDSDRRREVEEELEALTKLKLLEDKDRRHREEESELRRRTARANSHMATSARRIRATLEAESEAAVEEEATRSQAREIARRAMEEARRQELREATHLGVREQVRERAERRRGELERRKFGERAEQFEVDARLTADKAAAAERRLKTLESTRRAYSSQVEEKRERTQAAVEASRLELERDRAAERAYEAFVKAEADKLRTKDKSSFRIFH